MENKKEDKFKNKTLLKQGLNTRRTLQPINKPSKFTNKKPINQKIVKKIDLNNPAFIKKIPSNQSVLKSSSIQGPSTSALQQNELKLKAPSKVYKKDPTVIWPVPKIVSNKSLPCSISLQKILGKISLPSSITISKVPTNVQRKALNPGKTLSKEKTQHVLGTSNSENILHKLSNTIICKNKPIKPKPNTIKNKNVNISNATLENVNKISSELKLPLQSNKSGKRIIREKTATIPQTSKTSTVQKKKIPPLPPRISIKNLKKILPPSTKIQICKKPLKENCGEKQTITTSKTLQTFNKVPSVCNKTYIPIARKATNQNITALSSKTKLPANIQNKRTSPLLLIPTNFKPFTQNYFLISNLQLLILIEPAISSTSSKQLGSKLVEIKKKNLQPRKIDFNQCEPKIETSENSSNNIDKTKNIDANDMVPEGSSISETATRETSPDNINLFLNNKYRPHLKEINEELGYEYKVDEVWNEVTPLERKFLTFCVNPAEFESKSPEEVQEIIKNLRKQIL